MLNTAAACPIKKTHKIKEKLHNKDCTRHNYGYQKKKGGMGGTCSMDDKTKTSTKLHYQLLAKILGLMPDLTLEETT
jgi:hypothetical protein